MTVPRLVVAAPSSNAGKTSVATGLIAALTARGLAVSPHKVGPDYIDPGYHGLAAGRPGRNLDPWLVGEDRIAPLFLRGALHPRPADVAVVEGVMGLFDGASHPSVEPGFASTAHVAGLLRAPVLLVVDGSSQARSVAALVHGFATFDPGVRLGGVVLNRVGTDRHEAILRDALDAAGVPVLGAVRRMEQLHTPSRHLGLIPAAERSDAALASVRRLGEVVQHSVGLDAVLALARSAPPLDAGPWDPTDEVTPAPGRPRIAVAGGPAFTFGYAENAELLEAAGAEVVAVDPLRDEALPAGTAGLIVGGGFPEVHAAELSANETLRADIAALAARGAPIAAECAGLLYLARELDGRPMCGVLDVVTAMSPRLTLGYREAVAVCDSVLAPAGTRVRGHEFHRTCADPPAGRDGAWRWSSAGTEGFAHGSVHASYLHLNWAGSPQLAERFVAACATAGGPEDVRAAPPRVSAPAERP
ncbi:cobyrinate a,c-diamide synthase [Blastococcus sp. CCUG 61487]|uniref:cobyrinate a,c-diamide synthase n=1 Tax=Blastococcus sp. CCUG 61487 TaxID=1840703 RepID=UPI0010C0F804|nr:cobyrinate a,c-diamide synthase [Blastococcus sp. CCUG 61487]TKJ16757.1 cobyrinic acid a,c-diamide synthase [Blastococcus sp. CCUG 61487]